MKFSLCCCLKRNRPTHNISSRKVSFANSDSIIPTVTSAPLPLSIDIPIESPYENVIGLSDDRKISINNEQLTSTTSMEIDGYQKIIPIRLSQLSLDDDTELYATVDKTRKAKNAIRRKTDTALTQGSLSASATISSSQPISSSSSHRSAFTTVSEHPPQPLHVYTNSTVNTITNNHDNTSTRRSYHYENVVTRESLQYRDQHLKIEKEQTQQSRKNDYLSVNREREPSNSSDLYAELGNDSTSDAVYRNFQSHSYSRPSNGSEMDDNLSELYATVIKVKRSDEKSTTNHVFQEIDSEMF